MQPTNFNTLIDWQQCSEEQQKALLSRPAINASERITATVSEILDRVKAEGDSALRDFSQRFDTVQVADIRISSDEIAAAAGRLNDDIKQAMAQAVRNIEIFHNAQKCQWWMLKLNRACVASKSPARLLPSACIFPAVLLRYCLPC